MEEFRMPEQRVRDPAHSLSRIKQAIYILRCISVGRTWNAPLGIVWGDKRGGELMFE